MVSCPATAEWRVMETRRGSVSPGVYRLEQAFDDAPVGDVTPNMFGVDDVDLADDIEDAIVAVVSRIENGTQTPLGHGASHHGPNVTGVGQSAVGVDGRW